MIQFPENRKKPYFGHFLDQFWPKTGKKDFFSKIGLRHFLSWVTLGPHAKNQKNPMIQFGEKLLTHTHTHTHTHIRTHTHTDTG